MGATPDQTRASNPKASAWVGANAGSGKTHVLVDRVIRLMLEGVNPSTILCLTYTKAAATEMAGRLHERLGEWIGISDKELTLRLQKIGRDYIDHQTLARARRLFTAALETPGGFKIQTIHAFCERILQLFPIEAGMVPGFKVLDSKQTNELLEESRDHVLMQAQQEANATLFDAFTIVVQYAQTDAFDNLLENLIGKRREIQDLINHYGSLENFALELQRLLDVPENANPLAISDEFLRFDHAAVKQLIVVLASDDKKTNQETAAFYTALIKESDPRAAVAAYRNHFLISKGKNVTKPNNIVTAGLQSKYPWIADWLNDELARVVSLIESQDNLVRIKATLALLTIAIEITAVFEAAKQRRGVYDFEDLILRARDLLVDRQAAQWVLYKLDGGFEHVLVDEAQDTSLAQWQIVNALTEEFFSGAGTRNSLSRTLFVVGDRKQSIYSFQGADPAAFEVSREKFSNQILNVGQKFEDVDLTISYRSTAEILKIVDTVFDEGTPARSGLDGVLPGNLHHETNRKGEAGLFELWPLIRPDEATETEPWQAPVDREPATSPKRRLAKKIARTVKSWIGKRFITALGRTVEPGDILILFRTRNVLFDALISELRKEGVPVAGADRLKLAENIAVLDVMALVRFVLLPADDYSLACILKSPLVPKPLSEELLFALAHARGTMSLWERLEQSDDPDCKSAFAILQAWMVKAETSRPYEFLSGVLVTTRKSILGRLGSEAGDALDALLELSLSYEADYTSSLRGFADWFHAEDSEIKRNMESGRGEVRLMTIHGAKGLESSIVIMPDTTSIPSDRKSSNLMFVATDPAKPRLPFWRLSNLLQSSVVETWKDANKETGLEEYRRLLYVAMTRARDELYICGALGERKIEDSCWYVMVEEALKNPRDGSSLLRGVDQEDGTVIWRYGDDPTRGQAAPDAAKEIIAATPRWLWQLPAYPELLQTTVMPTRLVRHSVGSRTAVARGRTIHKILQEIPAMPPAQGLIYARRLLKKNQLDETLADQIVALVSNPRHAGFFGAEAQAEVTIGAVLPNGQRMTGKIDRLVIKADEILLLDYKTDWNVPKSLADDHPYLVQIAAYVAALRMAYGNRPIRTALLWTSLPRLDWVTGEKLEKAVSSMAAIT